MKPLEDWRVNRGMTGSFLCWKFEGKKSSSLKADISYGGRNPLSARLYGAGISRLPRANAEFLQADFGFGTSETLLR